jgi:hypothetical protein
MQLWFVVIAACGLAYFSLVKRTFDLFSLAYVSALVYFLPGFFGYALYPGGLLSEPVLLVPGTYRIMISVLVSIWLGAAVFDRLARPELPPFSLTNSELATGVIVSLATLGFVMALLTTGRALLSPDKATMMAELNRWHLVWVVGASLAIVCSFAERRGLLFAAGVALVAVDVFIGFRSNFAMAMLGVMVLWLGAIGPQRLVRQSWPQLLLCLGLGAVVFVYKFLYVAVKMGDVEGVLGRIVDSNFYLSALTYSEPFSTQAVLDAVVRSDLQVGMSHFSGLIYRLLFFAPAVGAESVAFNDLFQTRLFPQSKFGMASNIWAEMISSGGWPLLIGFLLLFVLILGLGSWLLGVTDPRLRGYVALAGSYWAFYIHRNDLVYQIDLEKRILVIFVAGLVGSSLLLSFVHSVRTRRKARNGEWHHP